VGDSSVVTVQYSLGDLYAISWASWGRWFKLLGWMIVFLLGLEIGLPLIAGERFIDALAEVDFYLLVPFALIVIAIPAISPLFQLRARRKQGWDVPMIVTLDNEGVSVDHPLGSQRTFWKAFPKIRSTHVRLFLFTAPSCAYILPKRCFSSEAEFQRWIEFSRRCWSEAKEG
jgi:hypothetical protein